LKILRFEKDMQEYYGIIDGDKVIEVKGNIFGDFQKTEKSFLIDEVKKLPPCNPSKIVAVGLNYKAHIEEVGHEEYPQTPVIFLKPPTSIIGPEDSIILPESERVDYEAELAIVIKKEAKNINVDDVNEYILGYTCLNDVTARDFQKTDGQWIRAKGHDTFCPIGPVISDEIDPNNVAISSILNGEIKQDSHTSNFIFNTAFLISFISNVMTLNPGDVIATGTPAGIGPMKSGDAIEISIEGIGILKNYVK
jgi:2-keto-4-pentenoate hydratase/2-oxohepta-3-ene-1,7-dioic acid hydratase in catechol pathway